MRISGHNADPFSNIPSTGRNFVSIKPCLQSLKVYLNIADMCFKAALPWTDDVCTTATDADLMW